MGELIVIYDAIKEIAAIVDVESHTGYGPAMIGPDSERLLEGFLLSIPYDMSKVDRFTLRDWFEDYMRGVGVPDTPPATAPAEGAVDPSGHTEVVESRAAVSEAVAESATPPAPAPADTDMEGNQGETHPVDGEGTPPSPAADSEQTPMPEFEGVCWNCDGTRMVPGPDGPVTCQICKGTGQLPAPATATT